MVEDLYVRWTLRSGEWVHFTMPRAAILRSFVLNHLVHHRTPARRVPAAPRRAGPGMYGPSADNEAMMARG